MQANSTKRNFTVDEFGSEFKLGDEETKRMLQSLYQFNVIGNTVQGTGNKRFRFTHRDPNGELDARGTMVIHPGLHRSMLG